MKILSLTTEFPNPTEPAKGLFVRARLLSMAERVPLRVVAPVALLDYANPHGKLLGSVRVPALRTEDGVEVRHVRWLYPPMGGWINSFFLFARLAPLVAALRRRREFDIIDAHYGHPEGIAAALLGAVLRVPFVITIRGSELRYRGRARLFWLRWALRRAERVISVSENLRSFAVELGVDADRVKTIPNGVNVGVFHRRSRQSCRARHRIADDAHVILCAGDLAELKGHHKVVKALQQLTASGLPAELVIAGGVGRSGRYAESIRQQISSAGLDDRVRLTGEVTQDTLAELMSAADVFCLASSSEGWPNVVNEALACGTPVVATNVGAVPQMLTSPGLGTIVPVDDVSALATALRSALTSNWDNVAIAKHGSSRSWSHVADDVLALLDEVLAERTAGGLAPQHG